MRGRLVGALHGLLHHIDVLSLRIRRQPGSAHAAETGLTLHKRVLNILRLGVGVLPLGEECARSMVWLLRHPILHLIIDARADRQLVFALNRTDRCAEDAHARL